MDTEPGARAAELMMPGRALAGRATCTLGLRRRLSVGLLDRLDIGKPGQQHLSFGLAVGGLLARGRYRSDSDSISAGLSL